MGSQRWVHKKQLARVLYKCIQFFGMMIRSISHRGHSMLLHDTGHARQNKKIDHHVGSRIRLRRTQSGMSQEQLAATLGISYQQIQKYETGANRISAGRLFEIGQRLDAGIAYFFDGFETEGETPEPVHGGRNRIAIDLVRNFLDIANEEQRAALATLVKTLKTRSNGAVPEPFGKAAISSA